MCRNALLFPQSLTQLQPLHALSQSFLKDFPIALFSLAGEVSSAARAQQW